jgi:DNA-binding transcriptional ArsR family regulator
MNNEGILGKHSHMTEDELYKAYKIFFGTLVSNPRLRIINLLRSGRKNVSEIMEKLNRDQTSVSHDLARLKRCGFVKVTIEGKYRYYSLNEVTIGPLMKIIENHMSHYCIHILHNVEGSHDHGR